MRTIHRFYMKFFLARSAPHREHIFEIVPRMSARNVEIFFCEVWRPDSKVSFIFMKIPEVLFDFFSDDHSLRLKEWES